MPGNKRPSHLKRQKEQKRAERAAKKRETRRLKQIARSAPIADSEPDAIPEESGLVPEE